MADTRSFVAVGFNTRFKFLALRLYLQLHRLRIVFFNSIFNEGSMLPKWLHKKNRVTISPRGVGEVRGLYFSIEEQSLKLTEDYYSSYLENIGLIRLVNGFFSSNKMVYFIKRSVGKDILCVLNGLCCAKYFSPNEDIIIPDTPMYRYVLNNCSTDAAYPESRVLWISVWFAPLLSFMAYIAFLLKTLTTRKYAWKDTTSEFRFMKEASLGMTREVMRDDFMVDGKRIRSNDVLFYVRYNSADRLKAAREASERGYPVIAFSECPINLKGHSKEIVKLLLFQPIVSFIYCLLSKQRFLTEYMMRFWLDIVPYVVFFSNKRVKCHFSTTDYEGTSETMVMNKFGCRNAYYHFSDLTIMKTIFLAYSPYNIYYSWGPIFYDFMKPYYGYDSVKIVGCLSLKAYISGLQKISGSPRKSVKKILLCDSTFGNTFYQTEDDYLDFLDLSCQLLHSFSDVMFIYKAKGGFEESEDLLTSDEKRYLFRSKLETLRSSGRVAFFHEVQFEKLLSDADLVVNMNVNSPPVITLLAGKEVLYYDTTGNSQHPLMRYRNTLVFDDREALMQQVHKVLFEGYSVRNEIDPFLLKQYDPFADGNALERLIDDLDLMTK